MNKQGFRVAKYLTGGYSYEGAIVGACVFTEPVDDNSPNRCLRTKIRLMYHRSLMKQFQTIDN